MRLVDPALMCMALKHWNLFRLCVQTNFGAGLVPGNSYCISVSWKIIPNFYRTYSTDMFWVVFLLGVKCSYLQLDIESRILKHPSVDTVGFALVFTLEYPLQCLRNNYYTATVLI